MYGTMDNTVNETVVDTTIVDRDVDEANKGIDIVSEGEPDNVENMVSRDVAHPIRR